FGFPPSALSFILEQFSQLGTVMRHVTVPNSNWVHLKYPSKIQAQLALSRNGKIFSSNIMVGVQPCVDLSVINSSQINSTTTPPPNTTTPIRAFNSSFKIPIGDVSQLVLNTSKTPQKDTGIISKAIDYIFGL
ncbi:hypothetical protein, partial [Salmonella sp. s51228]|uniref:hypothetical protein n=1 Tax=Salmonella sp. s51228 TaxID=3159652 RepID=UPI00397FA428